MRERVRDRERERVREGERERERDRESESERVIEIFTVLTDAKARCKGVVGGQIFRVCFDRR